VSVKPTFLGFLETGSSQDYNLQLINLSADILLSVCIAYKYMKSLGDVHNVFGNTHVWSKV